MWSLPTPSVVDFGSEPDAVAELDVSVRVPDTLPAVVEAAKPAVVEVAASGADEVCNVSACVALKPEEVLVLAPVGSAD